MAVTVAELVDTLCPVVAIPSESEELAGGRRALGAVGIGLVRLRQCFWMFWMQNPVFRLGNHHRNRTVISGVQTPAIRTAVRLERLLWIPATFRTVANPVVLVPVPV